MHIADYIGVLVRIKIKSAIRSSIREKRPFRNAAWNHDARADLENREPFGIHLCAETRE